MLKMGTDPTVNTGAETPRVFLLLPLLDISVTRVRGRQERSMKPRSCGKERGKGKGPPEV